MDILLACKFFSRKSKSRVSVTKFSKQLDSRIRVFFIGTFILKITLLWKKESGKWKISRRYGKSNMCHWLNPLNCNDINSFFSTICSQSGNCYNFIRIIGLADVCILSVTVFQVLTICFLLILLDVFWWFSRHSFYSISRYFFCEVNLVISSITTRTFPIITDAWLLAYARWCTSEIMNLNEYNLKYYNLSQIIYCR